jgi:hypothetical protein
MHCDVLNVENVMELGKNVKCKTCGREYMLQRVFMRHA